MESSVERSLHAGSSPAISAAERHRMLVEWNQTQRDYPRHLCIHQLFEAQALATPDAVALVHAGATLTYSQLNRRANQLAHHLRTLGVGPEVLVGHCLERSPDMVVGILAILKAGGAYVPLDPAYPVQRLALMLEDAAAPVLLTRKPLIAALPTHHARVVCLDADAPAIAAAPDDNPASAVAPHNLSYVIYTSGSTGRPKGVLLEHRNSVSFVSWFRSFFTPEELAAVAAVTSVSFDLSIIELFVPLAGGGRIVLFDNALALSPAAADLGITLVSTVPSALGAVLDNRGIPSSVQAVVMGGEPVPQYLVERFYRETQVRRVIDAYGPTETTTYSAAFVRTPGGIHSYGKPIANTQIYILDEAMAPVPIGVTGEVYLSGDGVARGYLNRPDVTAQRFIANPFRPSNAPGCYSGGSAGGLPGPTLYRSGDLARYRADGNIEPVGRIDEQVKVRGFRVELGEVESVLLQHPGVTQAAVAAFGDAAERGLAAYVVAAQPGTPPSDRDLRTFLEERLPGYMVPARFVTLGALPHTPNGKIDRRALPVPDAAASLTRPAYAPPRDETDAALARIFEEALHIPRAGIHDDFFDLGGNSLLAAQAVARVRRELRLELPLRDVFEAGTVAALADKLRRLDPAQGLGLPPIRPLDGTAPVPLSFAQQRLWFLDRFTANKAVYNIQLAVEIAGRLDIQKLRESINHVVHRHAALRTRVVAVDGEPFQEVIPHLPLIMAETDLTALTAAERSAAVERLAHDEADRPFDLSTGPLVRARLLRLSDLEHVLLLSMHHMVSDGWSTGVILDELQVIYGGRCAEQSSEAAAPDCLPPLPIQYADYAQWQRDWMTPAALEAQLSYWRRHLSGVPAILELPTDRPRPAVQSFRGAAEPVVIPLALADALKDLGRREGATLFMTLLAAFQALLARYSGRTDFLVGAPIAGRHRGEVENLIGFFVNTLALRADLSGDPTVRQHLARVREAALGAFSHQDVPFEKVVDDLRPARSPGYSPLIQVMFVLHNAPSAQVTLPDLTMRPRNITSSTAKVDLTLSLGECDAGMEGYLEYSQDLFDASTIRRMLGHLLAILQAMAADPARSVRRIPLLTEAERQQVLVDWNSTRRPYPRDATIHQLFQDQAHKTPAAIALVSGQSQLTYDQLNRRANQVAHHLSALGVGPGVPVGIHTDRSTDMVVAILATLKAGGAYLPLDAAFPTQRLRLMLEDARAPVVLTQRSLADRLLRSGTQAVCLDADGPAIDARPDTDPEPPGAPGPRAPSPAESLAYIIYTSGSTGRPKGVEVPHRGVLRLVCGSDYATFGPDRVFLQLAPISFDASTFELWAPLLHGSRCILYPDAVPTAAELGRALRDHAVTTLWLTASLYNALIRDNPEIFFGLSELLIGGEALNPAHVAHGLATLPRTRIINGYGPTECTTFACCYTIPRDLNPHSPRVPIGRPIANTQAYILDDAMEPVPLGVSGELYLGGDGLARGYLNQPQLTAERFVPNPFRPPEPAGCHAHVGVSMPGATGPSQGDFTPNAAAPSGPAGQSHAHADESTSGATGPSQGDFTPNAAAPSGPAGQSHAHVGVSMSGATGPSQGDFTPNAGTSSGPAGRSLAHADVSMAPQDLPGVPGVPGATLYRTGDLARWRPDGTIECLGRVDHQVKVRGFRIELGEIEAALHRHPAVAQSAVAAVQDDTGDRRLVSYVVPSDPGHPPSAEELRAFLLDTLPHYMVPTSFAVLASLPLTSAGKVDRRALPALEAVTAPLRPEFAPPRNPAEAVLTGIFQELLHVDRVGIHDDFFDLGGHSLLALRLSSRIEAALGVVVSLATILAGPTVARLADSLTAHRGQASSPILPLQLRGSRPILFFLPGLGGHVLSLRELARLLGPDQPVLGLQPRGLDGLFPPHETIPEMAAYFLEAVRQACPAGPYYLVGFSAGGTTAYEMAQQLHRAGQRVALLALLDTWGPGYPKLAPPSVRLGMHLRELARLGPRAGARYVGERFHSLAHKVVGRRERAVSDPNAPEGSTLRPIIEDVARVWREALSRYEVLPYPGRVDVFRAADTPQWLGSDFNDHTCGWGPLALGGTNVHAVPGDHLQIIRQPGVSALAAALRECLAEQSARSAPPPTAPA